MKPRFNLWIENKGKVVLSDWRVQLLRAVASGGSLRAAARRMRVPASTARAKLKEMERGLGFKLVESDPEGRGRGALRLTPRGEHLVERFAKFERGFDGLVVRRYRAAFGR